MNKEEVITFLNSRAIKCDKTQEEHFEKIMHSTLSTNEKFNLTAIKDESSFYEKMILDSALGAYDLDLNNKKVIDVGTGAGFPGLVLYSLFPQIHLTLLDSTKKKIDYLADFSKEMGWSIETVSSRMEDYAINHREEYDFAFARAVSNLSILLELIIPTLKIGGTFIAMKGPGAEQEIESAKKAFKKLGCRLENIYCDELPESHEQRSIIHIVKDTTTPLTFPRLYSEITKKPL